MPISRDGSAAHSEVMNSFTRRDNSKPEAADSA